MALRLSILRASELCIAIGEGTVTRHDIEEYLAHTIQEGAKGYAKLIDLTACVLALDSDDLELVADGLVQYGRDDQAGPVAIIVRTALNLDMAVLLKQRVGVRPFRIFTTTEAARFWLMGQNERAHTDVFPTGLSPHSRHIRPL